MSKERPEFNNWTNKHNLPDRVLRILGHWYKPLPDRISTTRLIDEPLPYTIAMKYWNTFSRDYSDMLNTIWGISLHDKIEKETPDDESAEEKIVVKIDGVEIVCKSDNKEGSILRDTKTMKVYPLVNKSIWKKKLAEFACQTNVYAWAWWKKGVEITDIHLDVYMRDWNLRDSLINKEYPKCPFVEVPVKLWTHAQQEQYVRDQIELHTMGAWTECSPEAKWQKPTRYAIMKKGQKKAVAASIPKTREPILTEAMVYKIAETKNITIDNNNYYIRKTDGECTRCAFFCPVRSICKHNRSN